jgi:hypothetical protein
MGIINEFVKKLTHCNSEDGFKEIFSDINKAEETLTQKQYNELIYQYEQKYFDFQLKVKK